MAGAASSCCSASNAQGVGASRARVAAALPVAAFGHVPDLAAWARFRDRTGIPVLLDAAAAFDALDQAAVPAMVSLHATKPLGVGEGGFIVSADESLVHAIRELSTFGFRDSRESQRIATNAKLSEYAAAVDGIAQELEGMGNARVAPPAMNGGPNAPENPAALRVSATRQGVTE